MEAGADIAEAVPFVKRWRAGEMTVNGQTPGRRELEVYRILLARPRLPIELRDLKAPAEKSLI